MIYEYECACDTPCPAACRVAIYSRLGHNDGVMEVFKLLIRKCNETPVLRIISKRELDLKTADIGVFILMFSHTKAKPEQLGQIYMNLRTLVLMAEQFKLFLRQDATMLTPIYEAAIEIVEKLIEAIVHNLEDLLIVNPKYYYM